MKESCYKLMSYLTYEGLQRFWNKTKNYIETIVSSKGGVPSGTIVIWSGKIANIPSGWALCNGQNGTPDLRNRFVYGTDTDSRITGGESTHVLTANEMPSHSHNLTVGYSYNFGNDQQTISGVSVPKISGVNRYYTYIDQGHPTTLCPDYVNNKYTNTSSIQNTGSGVAHNNMPPYITMAYIMKL